MTIRPLNDLVVVRPAEPEAKTPGGLLLPGTAKQAPQVGIVVAVGPGRLLDNGERSPVGGKVGDTVVYAKRAGTTVADEDGNEHKILSENGILAKATA